MFNFIYDILNDVDKQNIDINDLKYTNFNNKILYIEGHKDIILFEDECVIIKLNRGELTVLGKNFKLKEIDNKTIMIYGSIDSISCGGTN